MEGGTAAQQTIFYTAMYHAMIDPRIFADVNGDYPGGDQTVHHTPTFTKRTIFSGWDAYRSEFPLLTLIAPGIINDEINSWIELAEQNKTYYFDRWEMLNAYSGCMNGNPAITVINDAWQKGIRHYDVAKAYEFSVNTAEKYNNGSLGYRAGRISDTLEYGFHDWNLAQLAAGLGKTEDAAKYRQLSMAYKLLFDPEVPWTYDQEGKNH